MSQNAFIYPTPIIADYSRDLLKAIITETTLIAVPSIRRGQLSLEWSIYLFSYCQAYTRLSIRIRVNELVVIEVLTMVSGGGFLHGLYNNLFMLYFQLNFIKILKQHPIWKIINFPKCIYSSHFCWSKSNILFNYLLFWYVAKSLILLRDWIGCIPNHVIISNSSLYRRPHNLSLSIHELTVTYIKVIQFYDQLFNFHYRWIDNIR